MEKKYTRMGTRITKSIINVICVAIVGIVSSCTFTTKEISESMHLSEFIIGKWQAENQVQDIHGKYKEVYLVEFTNQDTLKFQVISPHSDINDKFQYKFLDDKTMSVENKRSLNGKWEISRKGDNILLCIWSTDNCLLFTRISS